MPTAQTSLSGGRELAQGDRLQVAAAAQEWGDLFTVERFFPSG